MPPATPATTTAAVTRDASTAPSAGTRSLSATTMSATATNAEIDDASASPRNPKNAVSTGISSTFSTRPAPTVNARRHNAWSAWNARKSTWVSAIATTPGAYQAIAVAVAAVDSEVKAPRSSRTCVMGSASAAPRAANGTAKITVMRSARCASASSAAASPRTAWPASTGSSIAVALTTKSASGKWRSRYA